MKNYIGNMSSNSIRVVQNTIVLKHSAFYNETILRRFYLFSSIFLHFQKIWIDDCIKTQCFLQRNNFLRRFYTFSYIFKKYGSAWKVRGQRALNRPRFFFWAGFYRVREKTCPFTHQNKLSRTFTISKNRREIILRILEAFPWIIFFFSFLLRVTNFSPIKFLVTYVTRIKTLLR